MTQLAGLRMVALANVVFFAGCAAAYWTRLSPTMSAVMALVVMLGAVLDLRHAQPGSQSMDRAFSFVVGALAMNAVLVVLPYLTVSEEGSLWDLRLFPGLELVVSAGGLAIVNHAVFSAAGSVASASRLAQVHLVGVAIAVGALFYLPDGAWVAVEANGYATRMLDLQWSPLMAAAASLGWAVVGVQAASRRTVA